MKLANAYIGHGNLLTPFGDGLLHNFQSILNNQCAYKLLGNHPWGSGFPQMPVGLISNEFFQRTFLRKASRAEIVLDYLIKEFLKNNSMPLIDVVFILYKNIEIFELYRKKNSCPKSLFELMDQRSVANIFKLNNLKISESNICIVDNTCTTGLSLLSHASQGITLNRWKNALVCTIDLITPNTLFCLHSLGALASRAHETDGFSRPFDSDRDGFVKTESGSLALVSNALETFEGNELMQMISFHQTNDAYRVTDGRDDGQYIKKAMDIALVDSGLELKDLAFIKSHGTSTMLNDKHEADVIGQVLKEFSVPVTSLKGHLGHTTDASGLTENLIAGFGLSQNYILPIKNCPNPEFSLDFVLGDFRRTNSKYFLSNAFGFGGHNISAVFRVL